MKLRLLWIAPACMLPLAGCSLFKTPDSSPEKPAAAAPKLIGRIASIPADRKFVLIQYYGGWNIEAGTILTTRGLENRSANLLATGESLGQFAAADLQAGAVEVGDAVYSRHVPKPPPPPTETGPNPEPPENQPKTRSIPQSENVQKNN